MSRPPSNEVNPAIASTDTSVIRHAAWHGLAWLALANLIGVWLAVLLLFPSAGNFIAPISYGRWMPVHLNLQLYGWISLPLIGWLLRAYRADQGQLAHWSKVAIALWSLALTLGSISWLSGHSSGKLFLDWAGYTRIFFPATILFLWMIVVLALLRDRFFNSNLSKRELYSKLGGAVLLFTVPFALYFASNPDVYPPINPSTGGPTGNSQLESVLIIVLILFLLPYGIARLKTHKPRWHRTCWIIFGLESLLCLALGRHNATQYNPAQYIGLGTVLIWAPLLPLYYQAFAWPANARIWLRATFVWWTLLLVTGWLVFLPGILNRFKFTDGLVGHSLMAMAGFVTTLLILVLVVLLEQEGDIFRSPWAFWAWQLGTFLYVVIMFYAGWIEGVDPAFTIVPGPLRNAIYWMRLLLGIAMTAASFNWLWRSTLSVRAEHKAPVDAVPLHENTIAGALS
jgi:cytochrome c oxidase cbb3-type subunit 1